MKFKQVAHLHSTDNKRADTKIIFQAAKTVVYQ